MHASDATLHCLHNPCNYSPSMNYYTAIISQHPFNIVTFILESTNTPRIKYVPASDMCRIRHRHCYTELCDFLKLLAVPACPCRVRAS